MSIGKCIFMFFLLVSVCATVAHYLAPQVLHLNPFDTGLASLADAYVFSNSTGNYVVVTLTVRKPVYVRFVAVSDKEWLAEPTPGREMKWLELLESEVKIPLNAELEPGVHTLVLRVPDDPSVNSKLWLCSMNYLVWTNSKGVRLVSVGDRAYPLEKIGTLKLHGELVPIVASGHIMNIYVYKLGGNVPWSVVPGFSLDPFRKELVNLLARGATEEEIARWARKVAEAIYESLLNGTSKAYITPTWEADRSAVERLYRAGTLSLVFDFQAQYIAELGIVETTSKVRNYFANLSYRRGAYVAGRYDHLYTGLRISSGSEKEYIVYPTDVFCDDTYAVVVVLGETPYTTPVLLGAKAPNKSLLESILKKMEEIK